MKRFLLIFITVIVLFSCGTDSDKDSGESALPNETEAKLDTLPDGLNFNGEVINIYVRGNSDGILEFYVENETGDIIEDSIYARNIAVEERINIKMNVIIGPGYETYRRDAITTIQNSIAAGDQEFDIIAGYSAHIPTLAVEGMFLNLLNLPYINLSQPWWNKSIVDELTIAGNLVFLAGDINLTFLDSCLIIYENNKLREDYNLPNIYDTVFADKWTIDYMYGLTKDIHHDLNGDGVMDVNDFYGALWDCINNADAFLAASQIRMTKMRDNNIPYLDVEHEKLTNLVDKVYNFFYNNEGSYVINYSTVPGDYPTMFKNQQGYITVGYLRHASGIYRDFETPYSIIPYPKYDELQEKYLTHVQDGMSILSVPINNQKHEAIGAFMEAAASESYRNVTPTYFGIAMKVKYARDETSAKMLDIIREGAYKNFACVYNYSIGSPYAVMRDLMMANSSNYASWFEKNEKPIEAAIDNLVAKMLENK